MDFAQARYFNSGFGRFSCPDPLQASGKSVLPQSWNRYTYSYNNPLKFNDPTGLIPDWVKTKSGEVFYDSRVVDKKTAGDLYGDDAEYIAPGYKYTANDTGDKIVLGEGGDFTKNGVATKSPDRATVEAPSPNGYVDLNVSAGEVLGVTTGIMVDNSFNVRPYFGGGVMVGPPVSASLGYSPDSISTGYNFQGQGIAPIVGPVGAGGSVGVDQRGNGFQEFNVGLPGASVTGFFVFGGNETILPQTPNDPTGPNAKVNSAQDYNRPQRPNCACNPMP